MFAVIQTGGKQYLVKPNQILKIEKIPGLPAGEAEEKGSQVVFDKVLMLANEDGSEVKLGRPYLEGAKVQAEILEQGRSKKIRVVKFKRKVRYNREKGHRQWFTKIRITQI